MKNTKSNTFVGPVITLPKWPVWSHNADYMIHYQAQLEIDLLNTNSFRLRAPHLSLETVFYLKVNHCLIANIHLKIIHRFLN